jgi:hypothetical protein
MLMATATKVEKFLASILHYSGPQDIYIFPFLLLCTRIYGLFDDAHIILGYTALGDKMIVNGKFGPRHS